jgi:hypothetical protein
MAFHQECSPYPPPPGPSRRAGPAPLTMFVWEGTDKRGVKMKGEQPAKTPTWCAPTCASRASRPRS